MPQTANGSKVPPKTPLNQKVNRPGQRQQERQQRLVRRRRRNRIISSTVAATLLVVLGGLGIWGVQTYKAQQLATANSHATAVALSDAHATGTAIVKDCFLAPSSPTVPPVYATGTPNAGPTNSPAFSGTPVTLSGGLKYIDVRAGTGTVAKKGSNMTVEYTGWLASNCQKFGSSYDASNGTPGMPFTLTLGKGQVIPGWDKGLVGMKVGGIRRLYIPSALAYGSQSNSAIPANSNLVFDVTLLSIS